MALSLFPLPLVAPDISSLERYFSLTFREDGTNEVVSLRGTVTSLVPEPASGPLEIAAMLGLALLKRRSRVDGSRACDIENQHR